jgi:hypothetical protein
MGCAALLPDCSLPLQVCANDLGCASILTCWKACTPGDQTCLDTCIAANPGGAPTFSELHVCVECQCLVTCSIMAWQCV